MLYACVKFDEFHVKGESPERTEPEDILGFLIERLLDHHPKREGKILQQLFAGQNSVDQSKILDVWKLKIQVIEKLVIFLTKILGEPFSSKWKLAARLFSNASSELFQKSLAASFFLRETVLLN